MAIFEAYSGIKVLDLTLNIAGPYCTQILADLGADVIKVERPDGDDTREMPPLTDTESIAFACVNRNKRSVVLDLKDAGDLQVALRLAADADVVVESFRPGTAERLGLGYEHIQRVNPTVVYCSVSAFGRGPVGQTLPGYDPLIQAMSGLMGTTGHEGEPPTRVAASIIDLSTGMWASIGIAAAIVERERTGLGQHVEATLVDTGYAMMCHQLSAYLATGHVPPRMGSGSPLTAPYEAFRTVDGWVMIAAGNQAMFGRLCAALGLPGLLDDPRFLRTRERVAHRHELHAALEEHTARQRSSELIALLRGAGVPVGPINSVDQVVLEPIVTERDLLTTPTGGTAYSVVRLPLSSGGVFAPAPRRPPHLGEHTTEVLSGISVPEGVGGPSAPFEQEYR